MFDYQSALNAGAKKEDILKFLSAKNNFNYEGALNAGASEDQIIQFLSTQGQSQSSQAPAGRQKGVLEKAAGIADTIFGGGKIGEYIGTKIGKNLIPEDQKQFYDESTPSVGQLAGSALQSASLFIPVGGLAGATTAGVRSIGISRGASAIGKIASGAIAGEAIDVASNLQEGKTGIDALKPGAGALIGAAIPGAGVVKNATVRFGNNQAPRVINSLIKPLAKDFSYGKNPGRAIAEEGIIANNFDDLITKITDSRQKVGREIGELGNKLSTKAEVNIGGSLSPLSEAMKVAASQNNPTLLNRLSNIKTAIENTLEPYVDNAGSVSIRSTGKRKLEGLTFAQSREVLGDIGDMTQFTGNPSDDKLVNSTLKRIYGNIKETTLRHADSVNPEIAKKFRKLTEKYGDLTSAEIAAKYRDKIVERSNLVGLSPAVMGVGTALITAVATGGAATPAILAGVAGATLDRLAQTPGFKTRLAALLSTKSQQEVNGLFQKIPALRTLFPQGSPVSPGDALIKGMKGNKGQVQAGALLAGVGITGAGTVLANSSNSTNYTAEAGTPIQQEITYTPDTKFSNIREKIAYRESRGSENPYTATNENKDGTSDYGKYQVNEQTLSTYSEKFLGRKVTPQEFLANPDLQEQFFDAAMKHLKSLGAKSDEVVMALWHKGWGDVSSKRVKELLKNPGVMAYINTK